MAYSSKPLADLQIHLTPSRLPPERGPTVPTLAVEPQQTASKEIDPALDSPEPGHPRVESIFPQKYLNRTHRELVLTFAESVQIEKQQNFLERLRWKPHLAGSWSWREPFELVFTPETRFQWKRSYTLRIPGHTEVVFESDSPSLGYESEPKVDDAPLRPLLKLVFNSGVELNPLNPGVRLTNEPPEKALSDRYDVSWPARRFFVEKTPIRDFPLEPVETGNPRELWFRPVEELPKNTRFYVWVSLGEEDYISFQTLGEFSFKGASGRPNYQYGLPQPAWHHLEFSHRIESFSGVRVDPPELEAAPVRDYRLNYIVLTGIAEPGEYAVEIARVTDVHGHTLRDISTTLTVRPGDPCLLGPEENVYLLSEAAPLYRTKAFQISHVLVEGREVCPEDELLEFLEVFRIDRRELSFGGGDFREGPHPHELDPILLELAEEGLLELPTVEEVVEQNPKPAKEHDWEQIVMVENKEMVIDLTEVLEKTPHFTLNLRPCRPDGTPLTRGFPICVWLQSSPLEVAVFRDCGAFKVFVVERKSGYPVAGAKVTAHLQEATAEFTTDEQGWLELPLPQHPYKYGPEALWFYTGDKTTVMPLGWYHPPDYYQSLSVYMWTDRFVYRPGETVYLKGWAREKNQDGALCVPGVEELSYSVVSQSQELRRGTLKVSRDGSFYFSFRLTSHDYDDGFGTLERGNCLIQVFLPGGSAAHRIEVRDFRPPEFEVSIRPPGEPLVSRKGLTFDLTASYYSGGALADAPVCWECTISQAEFVPAGVSGFKFGCRSRTRARDFEETVTASCQAITDSKGCSRLSLDLENAPPDQTLALQISGIVSDQTSQRWKDELSVFLHSSRLCVGLRISELFPHADTPLKVEVIVTDTNGHIVEGHPVEVSCRNQRQTVLSARKPVEVTFLQDGSGYHPIWACVRDEDERESRSSITLWSWDVYYFGGFPLSEPVSEAILILNSDTFEVGESVRAIVLSPFTRARGVLRVGADRTYLLQDFEVKDGQAALTFPVTAEMVPNVFLRVDLLAVGRYGHASVTEELKVPPHSHRLYVEVEPLSSECAPDAETEILVRVKNAQGQPVAGAEVALVVVDEAYLAVSDYEIPDPLSFLYFPKKYEFREEFLGSTLIPEKLDTGRLVKRRVTSERRGKLFDLAGQSPPPPPPYPAGPRPREHFIPTAHFEPSARTGEDGTASISFRLGSNASRYRVTAVAASQATDFGKGVGHFTARKPLLLHPSPPHFAVVGDSFQLPCILQNLSDETQTVEVSLEASEGLSQASVPNPKVVELPAGQRTELVFDVQATAAKTGRFVVTALGREAGDSVLISIPVHHPVLPHTSISYGRLDQEQLDLELEIPADCLPTEGDLRLQLSTTALSRLGPFLRSILGWSNDHIYHVATRTLSLLAMESYQHAFPELAERKEEISRVIRGLLRQMLELQRPTGGWSVREILPEDPRLSLHVTHALVLAKQAGYPVPAQSVERALNSSARPSEYPEKWSYQQIQDTLAYRIYVRHLYQPDLDLGPAVDDLLARRGPSLETWAWLVLVLDGDNALVGKAMQAMRSRLYQGRFHAVIERPLRLSPIEALNVSTRKDSALWLLALLQNGQEREIAAKLARGLLLPRDNHWWNSSADSAYAVLALGRYYQEFEAQMPALKARAHLGPEILMEETWDGRIDPARDIQVPLEEVLRQDARVLGLSRTGVGTLYYRLSLTSTAMAPSYEPDFQGFEITREYLAQDEESDVQRTPGGWRVRLGANVLVKMTIRCKRRYHVRIDDYLPAGMEIEHHTTTSWSNREFRDDGIRAYSIQIDGLSEFQYQVRATTAGSFTARACKVEEIYRPECFGSTGASQIEIVESDLF